MITEIPLDEIVHFDEITVGSDRAAVDADSTPTFSVYEEANDTAILSAVTFTKRTGKTGNYRGTFQTPLSHGFETGKWYNVISTAVVESITGKKKSMTFRIVPSESVAGYKKVDAEYAAGSLLTVGDFTLVVDVNADGTRVTLPEFDSEGVAIPNDASHAYKQFLVVSGTGKGQLITMTTRVASTRQWNCIGQTTQTDATSKCNWVQSELMASLISASIAALNNLSQANIRTAVGLATANLDTQLDALPTNAELATALAAADDAVLAAVGALNNLSQANIRAAVGLGSANLDTQLDALPTAAEVTAAVFARAFSAAYGSHTFEQIMEIIVAAASGASSGLDTGNIKYRNLNNTGDVIAAVGDIYGNRSSVTRTP